MPSTARRLAGVDVARGVALLGMMSVHIVPAADPDGGTSTAYVLASGRAAALFAVLAGVGLALASGGTAPPHGRRWAALSAGLVVRALAIAVIGVALGTVDTSNVALILVYYALLFLLAVPLLPLRSGALVAVALCVAVVVPVVSFGLRDGLASPGRGDPTFAAALDDPAALITVLGLTGYYPALAWVTYLAAGLAVGRLDLRSPRTAVGLLGVGALVAVGAKVASALLLGPLGGRARLLANPDVGTALQLDRQLERSLYGNVPTSDPWWLTVAAPHSSTTLDLLHTTGAAIAVLGACLLLVRWVGPLLQPLAWAGSMTLTLYVLHVLVLGTRWGPSEPVALWVTHAIGALLIAAAWRSVYARGPLEAVVQGLSRGAVSAVGGERERARA